MAWYDIITYKQKDVNEIAAWADKIRQGTEADALVGRHEAVDLEKFWRWESSNRSGKSV